MGAISKESIRRSDTQLVAKQPYVEPTLGQQDEATFRAVEDATYAFRPSSSSTPSFSSGVEASLAAILDQIQLMRDDFNSRLEMCQMNT